MEKKNQNAIGFTLALYAFYKKKKTFMKSEGSKCITKLLFEESMIAYLPLLITSYRDLTAISHTALETEDCFRMIGL